MAEIIGCSRPLRHGLSRTELPTIRRTYHVVFLVLMIRSWKNAATRQVYDGDDPGRLRGVDFELARRRLAALNVAKSLQDLGQLRSVGLHKLKGDRRGQWAVSLNGRWRICFRYENGDAYDVEITDYHKG